MRNSRYTYATTERVPCITTLFLCVSDCPTKICIVIKLFFFIRVLAIIIRKICAVKTSIVIFLLDQGWSYQQ